MGNIDASTISALLSRIGSLRTELESIEDELKMLISTPDEGNGTTAAVAEPIDISISDIDTISGIDLAGPASVESEEAQETDIQVEAPKAEETEVPQEAAVETMAEKVEDDLPEETVLAPEETDSIAESKESKEEDMPEDDLPFFEEAPAKSLPVPSEAKKEKVQKAIVDAMTADTAVMDVMADRQAWRTDRAGTPVKNVISAISLNDRVLLINVLFKEDAALFQETIAAFNGMSGFEEAVTYVKEKFPEWDLDSEPVYRLMMAVRRKLS